MRSGPRWRGECSGFGLTRQGAAIRVVGFLIRYRYVSLGLLLLALAGLLRFGKHVEYEQALTSFFPAGDPQVRTYDRTAQLFGNDNFVFVGYDDPGLLTPQGMDRVEELAAALAPGRVDAVEGVESLAGAPLFWELDERLVQIETLPALMRPAAKRLARQLVQAGDGTTVPTTIGPAVRAARGAALDRLRAQILAHPLLQGTLVNAEGTSTVVVVHLAGMKEQDVRRTVASLREKADQFAVRHRLARPALVGPPVLLADGFVAIERDGRRLALVGMALIGLVMFSATGSLWWALAPLAAGWTVWLAAETLLASLGLKLSLSGGPLVAQIIVLTMPAASHLAIHFRDEMRLLKDRRAAALETIASVSPPVIWCAATGMLGYGALLTSEVVPIRQFGTVLGVCTLLAALLTLLISPIPMLPPFGSGGWRVRSVERERRWRPVERLLGLVYNRPYLVLGVMLGVAVPLVFGMGRLRFESNYINAFQQRTRVVQDYRTLESRLGGIGLVSIIVPVGPKLTMEQLDRFRSLDRLILGNSSTQPQTTVSRVISLASVLDPQGRLRSLPPDRAEDALRTKLELIALAPQADLMRTFWNSKAGLGRILVRVPEQQDAVTKERTFEAALESAQLVFGPDCLLTGLSYLLTRTTRSVMASSWTTFGWASGSILLMLLLAYRSAWLALLAMLPSLLAVGMVLGLTGWLGVKLDLATALVASVALGLAVDDTFHCLLLFRHRRHEHETFRESLFASYMVTGPGVVLSSLAVAAGFAVLWLSDFVPFSNFGMMVGVATLGSSIGNLVLLPAFLTAVYRHQDRESGAQPPASTENTSSASPS